MNLHLQLTWSTHLAYITALHKQRLQFCFLVSISLFHWGLNGWMWCQQHSNWKLSISWGLKAAEKVPQVMIKQYCSKTQWQMFLLVSSCHVGAPHEGYQHGVSIQSSINLGKTFLSILLIGKIAQTWFLARLFGYSPPFISQILDLIYWMVLIFDGQWH